MNRRNLFAALMGLLFGGTAKAAGPAIQAPGRITWEGDDLVYTTGWTT